MNILCFGASSSKESINKKFAVFTAGQIEGARVTLLDLNDYEMALFSVDRESESGIPDLARTFKKKIRDADALVVSFAEHNGAYTAAFKNILDWVSRIEGKLWEEKPFFALSTSPGARGGSNVLEIVLHYFPFMGAQIKAHFSLPKFYQNFDVVEGIIDETLRTRFDHEVTRFSDAIID